MGIWNELMYLVMMLFALTSNLSIAATSVCIVLGAILVIAQRICTGSLPDMDKGLVKMVGIYCVLQIVAALMAPDVPKSLEEVWGTVYRISPLFMGLGYLQTRRRMAWILVAFAVSVFVGDAMGAYQLIAWDDFSPTGASNQSAFYATHLLMALPIFILCAGRMKGYWPKRQCQDFCWCFPCLCMGWYPGEIGVCQHLWIWYGSRAVLARFCWKQGQWDCFLSCCCRGIFSIGWCGCIRRRNPLAIL